MQEDLIGTQSSYNNIFFESESCTGWGSDLLRWMKAGCVDERIRTGKKLVLIISMSNTTIGRNYDEDTTTVKTTEQL